MLAGVIEVRRGITRAVLLIGPWAVKVPRLASHGDGAAGVAWSWTRGVQANLSERTWAGSPGTVPLLVSLAGLVNVYERAVPVPETTDRGAIDWDAIGFECPGDRKVANVGWLRDGRMVWLDFDLSWNDAPPCCDRRAPVPEWAEPPAYGVVGRDVRV